MPDIVSRFESRSERRSWGAFGMGLGARFWRNEKETDRGENGYGEEWGVSYRGGNCRVHRRFGPHHSRVGQNFVLLRGFFLPQRSACELTGMFSPYSRLFVSLFAVVFRRRLCGYRLRAWCVLGHLRSLQTQSTLRKMSGCRYWTLVL